ncbi:hypothetical protein NHX12_010554 [Muraenolepis orangiensis]|uniref:Uncharacterized protein n=1 Tax=Muraenolepis orangiensis TaxID=630683 RepID=A0A9Q0DLF3_9TELE|nr:hypothetical protein NHX12_010554 [Muraenolepis orangiensis]
MFLRFYDGRTPSVNKRNTFQRNKHLALGSGRGQSEAPIRTVTLCLRSVVCCSIHQVSWPLVQQHYPSSGLPGLARQTANHRRVQPRSSSAPDHPEGREEAE